MSKADTVIERALALICTSAAALAVVSSAAAQSPAAIEAGKKEFASYCAPCHGIDARGTGPLADIFKTPVPDLTVIAKQNDGNFPFLRVINIIDGRADILSHGGRDMPVWGDHFRKEDDPTTAQGRILNLTLFLAGIQTE